MFHVPGTMLMFVTALRTRLNDKLFEPRDISSLAFFRVAFGTVMLWEVYRYFRNDWVEKYFLAPGFNFTYEFFDWVKPWPGEGMIFHFYLLGILSVLIILGLFYRIASVLFFLGFTYFFLLEQARYLNHFYLVLLVSFLMIFLPAHRKYSMDAWLRKNIQTSTVPFWSLFLLQFQIGAVYFFGAIAKMNADWFSGEPLRHWLSTRVDFPGIGPFFDQEWGVYAMSYSGLLLDLLAPFFLLWRKTRPFMMTAVVVFHFMNDRMFSIGIFPWFMILASTIFFPADWPKQFFRTVRENRNGSTTYILAGAAVASFFGLVFHNRFSVVPTLVSVLAGGVLVWSYQSIVARGRQVARDSEAGGPPGANLVPGRLKAAGVTAFVFLWVLFQTLVPLRHFLIAGNVSWTEEGHRFAWHMKLRSKNARIKFLAYNPDTEERFEIDPRKILTPWQLRKMSTRPYMIVQFAHHLAEELRESGRDGFEIRALSVASLNYRPYQTFIDPNVDLSKVTFDHFKPNEWIRPLEEIAVPRP